MGDIISLRAKRKEAARKATGAQAAENAAKFGRTKAQKAKEAAEISRAKAALDGKKVDNS